MCLTISRWLLFGVLVFQFSGHMCEEVESHDFKRIHIDHGIVFKSLIALGEAIDAPWRYQIPVVHYAKLKKTTGATENKPNWYLYQVIRIRDKKQVLIGLRYLAKGDLLSEVADLHGVSRSSACQIIERFIEAVNDSLDNIRFPVGREIDEIKYGFYQNCGIPNTVGAVDGTLIPIIAPTVNEEAFVCRKNYHAVNVQAVVDHKGRFVDVVSKWPGSTHDASIFENCSLKVHLERNDVGVLLGDSGYGLKKYLLTPVLNPSNEREMNYNRAHSRGRMVVERSFGILKSRFRCLHKTGGVLYRKPERACKIFVACARLHNLCLQRNIQNPDVDDLQVDADYLAANGDVDIGAVQHRQQIIDLF